MNSINLQNGHYYMSLKNNHNIKDNTSTPVFIYGEKYHILIKENLLLLEIGKDENGKPLWNQIMGWSGLLEYFDIEVT